jgi:carbon monoxide dehydrogenase subunit G
MSSVRKEVVVNAPIADVWDALRDLGALHDRLVPGFVVDTKLEADNSARLVTFGNGAVVRERIVAVDETDHRVAWSAESEYFTHHNASAQVLAVDPRTTRFVWIADVLPDEAAAFVGAMMDEGLAALAF